jgi:hypothetical protein
MTATTGSPVNVEHDYVDPLEKIESGTASAVACLLKFGSNRRIQFIAFSSSTSGSPVVHFVDEFELRTAEGAA